MRGHRENGRGPTWPEGISGRTPAPRAAASDEASAADGNPSRTAAATLSTVYVRRRGARPDLNIGGDEKRSRSVAHVRLPSILVHIVNGARSSNLIPEPPKITQMRYAKHLKIGRLRDTVRRARLRDARSVCVNQRLTVSAIRPCVGPDRQAGAPWTARHRVSVGSLSRPAADS
jgi:hypothetical protein